MKKAWKYIKRKKKLFGIIGAAVAIVALVLVIFLPEKVDDSEKPQAKEAVEKYYEAFKNADTGVVIEMTYPSVIQEGYFELVGTNLEDKTEDVELQLNAVKNSLYDVGGEYTCSIKQAEHLDKLKNLKSISEGDGFENLDAFKEKMSYWYESHGMDVEKISKAYAVQIEFVMDANGEEYTTSYVTYTYKYEDTWYIIDMNTSSLITWITSAL